ncbi:hemolysin family protein [Anaerolentibacter hominis]|uniref:HlyC/CorC family transporter n=1 Tax=Anaerolentibacter hominis TaxID=3079009 RepID=UPI0031B83B69
MDPSDVSQWIILFLLLLLSAFFSSAETALTTVNKLRMRMLEEDKVKGASIVNKLLENQSKMLSAILIGNNIVNLTASSLTTSLVIRVFGNYAVGIATGILTFMVLVFGEIMPKSIATANAEALSLKYARVIYLLTILLTPVIFIVNIFSQMFLKLFKINMDNRGAAITENELRTIVDVSHEEGVIESEERRMITNVVDFGDSYAKDVMIPRIDMECVDADCSYKEIMEAFRQSKFTRLPVYRESRDNIVGILNLKDLFFFQGDQESFSIEDLMRAPLYTYEFKKTSELLIEMRRESSLSMAIVLDEYGATAGLITLEDLLEEIVGEIRDEYDEDEEDIILKLSDTEYLVDGGAKLDEINETIGLNLQSDDYDSIAGHIIHLLDYLPVQGEKVTDKNITFTVENVEKNRIDKIRIHIDGPLPEEEDE